MRSTAETDLDIASEETPREALDWWVREIVEWHFNPETGCPTAGSTTRGASIGIRAGRFAAMTTSAGFPASRTNGRAEGLFADGRQRLMPIAPPSTYLKTGGSTGVPESRINIDDFRIDYEAFSDTLPDESFPTGSDWLMLGPTGPRRLRLAVEHLAQHRGGICFTVDLDPRWVIKLMKTGRIGHDPRSTNST